MQIDAIMRHCRDHNVAFRAVLLPFIKTSGEKYQADRLHGTLRRFFQANNTEVVDLLPAIRGCAMGQSGLATAGIVVRNTGKVASVRVTGAPFAGAPSGRCMEGVVRKARFPAFRQASFRVRYPFSIQ